MRVRAFNLNEPLPELNKPHALAMLRPWIDVGNVGTMLFNRLESIFQAKELGKLAIPGNFFDFTRYRPSIVIRDNVRQLEIPNVTVTYARREKGNDFLFFHLLEPHMLGELYTDSILRLLQIFNVKRYILVGSMYDIVPHTKPLLVTGSATKNMSEILDRAGVQSSNYQGPTTITYLVSQKGSEIGIESTSLIVHLPQYLPLEEDFTGLVRLMEVLSALYNFPVEKSDIEKAEDQRRDIDLAVGRDPKLKAFVTHLESYYEDKTKKRDEETKGLSPEIEGFLKDIEKRFKQN